MVGIYCIRNILNNKRYIGKSKQIAKRFWEHKNSFKLYKKNPEKYKKKVNRHLAAAVCLYGIENFEFEILETFVVLDDALLADAEVKWMEFYNTTDRDFGYNLVKDSSQLVLVHPETCELISKINLGEGNPNYGNRWTEEMKDSMSQIKKQQHREGVYAFMQTPEWKDFASQRAKTNWKDEKRKGAMARKVSEATSVLRFEQYDKNTGEFIAAYDSILKLLDANPGFKKTPIYSVCNGWKKSYKGFIWKSFIRLIYK